MGEDLGILTGGKFISEELGIKRENVELADPGQAGIVDPKNVTRTALQNAASIAGLLLPMACRITEMPEKRKRKKPAGGADPDGMGDMGYY